MADEIGWLIEENYGGGCHWIALPDEPWPRLELESRRFGKNGEWEQREYRDPIVRTKVASEGLRFARKEDAEAFIRMFGRWLLSPYAAEHMWHDEPPRSTEARKDTPHGRGEG